MSMIKQLALNVTMSACLLLLLATPTHGKEPETQHHTFVLVHGATGGGWDWKTVGHILSEKGHTVYRATLTGLGERYHLNNAEIGLKTHVDDVANLILFEEIRDVILVGHSYGGMVITGVVDQIPEHVRHLVFLDAAAPNDGMSMLDLNGGEMPPEHKIIDGVVHFNWLNSDTPLPRDVPQSLKTFTDPVSYRHPLALKINASFVAFVSEGESIEERMKSLSWQNAIERGWTVRTFAGDHVIYRRKPLEMAELLISATEDQNK